MDANDQCVDIDECTVDNGECGSIDRWRCVNEPGGHACECADGFVLIEDECINKACTLNSWTAQALEGCDRLAGADLAEANLTGADLAHADMSGADLTGANISGADVTGADLDSAQVDGLRAVNLTGCPAALPPEWACLETPYEGIILAGPGANLSDTNLAEADMMGINMTGAYLTKANLSETDLTDVTLDNAELSETIMKKATANELKATYVVGCPNELPSLWVCITTESGTHLIGPNARISDTDFSGADLSSVTLTGANGSNANFKAANLTGANLTAQT